MSTLPTLTRSLQAAIRDGSDTQALQTLASGTGLAADVILQGMENAAQATGQFPQLFEAAQAFCATCDALPPPGEYTLGNLAYGAHDFDAAVTHYSRSLFVQGRKVQALEGLKAVQAVRDLRHLLNAPIAPHSPPDTPGTPVLHSGPQRVVHLTIDDGPHPATTPALLALLARFDQQATFFFTGKGAELYPDLVRQTADHGHGVFGHSYDHSTLYTQLSHEACLADIDRTEAILTGLRGAPERLLYRFPGGMGHADPALLAFLAHERPTLELAHWTATCQDGQLHQRWCRAKNPRLELIASIAQLLRNVRGGGEILLAHEILFRDSPQNGRDQMTEAFFGLLLRALDEKSLRSRPMG